MTPELNWFKSSYSSNDGPECVEVAIASPSATVHVRDSKTPHRAQLALADRTWADFIAFTRRPV